MTRALAATALAGLLASPNAAVAEPVGPDAAVTLGVGAMTTRGSLGDERVVNLAAAGSWFPRSGPFGGRLHLGLSRVEGGTTLVNSERISGTLAAFGTGRLRLAGPLYGVAGLGPAAVLVRTHHLVVSDRETVWTARPALSWTAGLALVYEQLIVRAEHTGAWSDLSRDLIYAIHVGMVF